MFKDLWKYHSRTEFVYRLSLLICRSGSMQVSWPALSQTWLNMTPLDLLRPAGAICSLWESQKDWGLWEALKSPGFLKKTKVTFKATGGSGKGSLALQNKLLKRHFWFVWKKNMEVNFKASQKPCGDCTQPLQASEHPLESSLLDLAIHDFWYLRGFREWGMIVCLYLRSNARMPDCREQLYIYSILVWIRRLYYSSKIVINLVIFWECAHHSNPGTHIASLGPIMTQWVY